MSDDVCELSDEAFAELADELFQSYDAEEAEDISRADEQLAAGEGRDTPS